MSQVALVYESKIPNARQRLQLRPMPEPESGQIQVKIHATAVNPVDWKIFDYGMFVTTFPTVLGTDAAGEVTKVAPDVKNFKIGDRVLFQGQYNCQGDSSNGDKATFQHYCTADADLASKIPENIDYDSASTFSVGAVTAAAALYDLALGLTSPWTAGGEGLYTGKTFVVLGGSSSVGSYAVQLAALSGFQVITTSSPAHFASLKSLGASAVIDRSSATVASDIVTAAGGQVPYVVDAISLPSTQQQGVDILQTGGKLVLVLGADRTAMLAAFKKNINVIGAHGASHMYPEFNRGFWSAVEGYLERGVLKPNKPRVLSGGLNAWEEAYDLYRQGKVSGEKIVLRPQETVREDLHHDEL